MCCRSWRSESLSDFQNNGAAFIGEKISLDPFQPFIDRSHLKVINWGHLFHHIGHIGLTGASDITLQLIGCPNPEADHDNKKNQHRKQKGYNALFLISFLQKIDQFCRYFTICI